MIAAWNRFWFATGSIQLVCLLRIYVGICLLLKRTGINGLYHVDDWKLQLPRHTFRKRSEFVGDGFQAPLIDWLDPVSYDTWKLVDDVQMVGAVLMIVGFGTRLVVPGLAAIHLFTLAFSTWTYVHHNNVYAATLVLLAVAPCADWWSLDAWIFRRGRPPPVRRVTSLRALQVLVSVIYASTTFGKLNHGWWSGRMMEVMHETGHFRGPFAPTLWALTGPELTSHFTLFAEGICAFGLWIPQVRLLSAFSGVSLHMGIDMMMPVTTFSYQMISSYVLFLDPVARRNQVVLPRVAGWLVRLLDWTARFTVVAGPGFAVTTSDGRAFRGAGALRELGLRLPILFPAAFVLGLPFTLWGRARPFLRDGDAGRGDIRAAG